MICATFKKQANPASAMNGIPSAPEGKGVSRMAYQIRTGDPDVLHGNVIKVPGIKTGPAANLVGKPKLKGLEQ